MLRAPHPTRKIDNSKLMNWGWRDDSATKSTQKVAHNLLVTSVLGDLMPSSDYRDTANMWYTDLQMGKRPLYTK